MFHFTTNIRDWPRAVEQLPAHYAVKAVDNVQMLAEAKARNPGIVRILRHHVVVQQPGTTYESNVHIARAFLRTFIDGTFLEGSTAGVPHRTTEYVEGWNEYAWHPTQDPEEGRRYNLWVQALLDVWYGEYWPQLGTNIIIGNVAVGNDISIGAAQQVARHTNVKAGKIPRIGYHPYWPVQNKQLQGEAESWKWYQGRWATLDAALKAQGIGPLHWALTEAGAVGARGTWPHISLDPIGGWRTDYVYGGDWNAYTVTIRQFMEQWQMWNLGHGYRCLSPNLFNSGGPGHWEGFQLEQPQLDAIAQIARDYPTLPPEEEPAPPPVQLVRTTADANLRLHPYFYFGSGNVLLSIPEGSELQSLGMVEGQAWRDVRQWAKVRVKVAYENGNEDVDGYVHALLVEDIDT